MQCLLVLLTGLERENPFMKTEELKSKNALPISIKKYSLFVFTLPLFILNYCYFLVVRETSIVEKLKNVGTINLILSS